MSHSSNGLDSDDLDFLSNHLSTGTRVGYGYVLKRFRIFCDTLHENPLTCGPAIVIKYIRKMYAEGAEYRTINFYRSSISKFHVGFDGVAIGSHPLNLG